MEAPGRESVAETPDIGSSKRVFLYVKHISVGFQSVPCKIGQKPLAFSKL